MILPLIIITVSKILETVESMNQRPDVDKRTPVQY